MAIGQTVFPIPVERETQTFDPELEFRVLDNGCNEIQKFLNFYFQLRNNLMALVEFIVLPSIPFFLFNKINVKNKASKRRL